MRNYIWTSLDGDGEDAILIQASDIKQAWHKIKKYWAEHLDSSTSIAQHKASSRIIEIHDVI
jgi:hypothetical protein